MDTVDEILQANGLKKTNMRRDILHMIMLSKHALSQSNIEAKLENPDRVTIYRTLNTFESSGLIHKITGADKEISYAYCADHCHDGIHEHDHIHFSCTKCDKTFCLNHVKPEIILPKGYQLSEINVLAEGTCDSCSN